MTRLDRLLQRWRISKAIQYVPVQCRLLDIGCHQGEMLAKLQPVIQHGVGIDPICNTTSSYPNIQLLKGEFPEAIQLEQPFNIITALALVEHIPSDQLPAFFAACYQHLVPGGKLVCTIPHRFVDHILALLAKVRLIDGMSVEEHHGFDSNRTPALAADAGFLLFRHETFQLGLNNLFVFQKPIEAANH